MPAETVTEHDTRIILNIFAAIRGSKTEIPECGWTDVPVPSCSMEYKLHRYVTEFDYTDSDSTSVFELAADRDARGNITTFWGGCSGSVLTTCTALCSLLFHLSMYKMCCSFQVTAANRCRSMVLLVSNCSGSCRSSADMDACGRRGLHIPWTMYQRMLPNNGR